MTDRSRQSDASRAGAWLVAHGNGWRATEIVCQSGPGDRPFEERHDRMTIAGVLGGSFTYRSGKSRALLHTGALLLGNNGACYECGHEHGRGDRCIALNFDADYFGEIAASVAGKGTYMFPAAALYTAPAAAAALAQIGAEWRDPLARDLAVVQIVERVLRAVSDLPAPVQRVSAKDAQRLAQAMAFIEAHASEKLDLQAIAVAAGMSKYHFLRVFRQHVGVTPYRYVLDLRLRRAAGALAASVLPVTSIAYDMGFGDLSTFSRQFAAVFGSSPQRYRAQSRARNSRANVGRAGSNEAV